MLKRITFWNKIMLTAQAIGTAAQLTLIFGNSQHIYNVLVALLQMVGLILPIWIEDKNNNGTVDAFEKEVTVKVTSDSPIKTEVTVEKKDDSSAHSFTEGADVK